MIKAAAQLLLERIPFSVNARTIASMAVDCALSSMYTLKSSITSLETSSEEKAPLESCISNQPVGTFVLLKSGNAAPKSSSVFEMDLYLKKIHKKLRKQKMV